VAETRSTLVRSLAAILRAVVRGVLAGVLLLLGLWLIYAFGGGYFGDFLVPTPFNVIVSLLLLVVLIVGLRRFLLATK
jgi:hypothetical protein